ncbi:MAG TPA: DUF4136 domain-containing protein [Burkholderiales bacterium]|nr:DUF4136 domain-containing protein [Burkholderiales bacterium]
MSAKHREISMRWYGLALALAVMTAGCATTPGSDVDVTFDYDTAANFDALKSYSWMPPAGNAAGDELLVKRIKNSLDSQLQAKGRAPAEASPDFLIGMQLSGKTTYGGSTGVGVSVGIPVGRAGRVSVGGGKSQAIEKKEGQLVLDFVDAKSKSLLWRATASGAVNPGQTPEQQQQRINGVIAEMLSQFPPGKK